MAKSVRYIKFKKKVYIHIDEGIQIITPSVYANLSDDKIKYIFRSHTNEEKIPLLQERTSWNFNSLSLNEVDLPE